MEQNLNKHIKLWLFLMKVGEFSGCHQMYERSFKFRNYQFPICARCTGIFVGQIFGIILWVLGLKINLLYSVIIIIPMAIDGLIQLVQIKQSNNIRRVITGFIAGIGYTFFLINIIIIIKHLVF